MNRLHLALLTLILTGLGLGIFAYKALVLHFPLLPHTASNVWTVEVALAFGAHGEPVKAAAYIPKNTGKFLLVDESFISRGFGLTTVSKETNRQAIWSKREATGKHTVFYRAVIRRVENEPPPVPLKAPEQKTPVLEGAFKEAAESILQELRGRSADTESLVRQIILRVQEKEPDHALKLLLGKKASALKKAQTAVALINLAGIPARVVHGIVLKAEGPSSERVQWIELFEKKGWHPYNSETGDNEISEDWLPWWRGNEPLLYTEGVQDAKATLSVEPHEEEAIQTTISSLEHKNPWFLEYSMFSLPIQTQMVYRVLLLVPLGALMVALLRNVIGIKTFGTFMPILVALAFRETELLWGIMLFTVIVGLGLVARFYLENLKLLLVPRLASILVIVIMLMAIISVLSHKLGITYGTSVALFPMVIMTMTVERMSVVWDELGAASALRQALGTLLVASLTYLLIRISVLEHLVFVFPELLLVVLAVCILLGRYSGYRLLELPRFRSLLDNQD
ncbi:MAG: UUP1 family membrane protein [Oligoflexia bacterium]|nr:UUP1 family membrane protein [Oligoflexia bacterium]